MANVLEAAISAAQGAFGDRLLGISGSFAPGTFSVEHFRGSEGLGSPFSYDVTLISPTSDFDISSLVGDTVTITVGLGDDNARSFNGYVTQMSLVERAVSSSRHSGRVVVR